MERHIRVLIADDSRYSRDGLRALLNAWPGILVVGEATTGWEVLRLVDELHPTVVLMDARMPGLDGVTTTRYIKEGWPEIRVVMLTIYPHYRAAALAAGADRFLVKGCSADELLGAVLNILDQPAYLAERR